MQDIFYDTFSDFLCDAYFAKLVQMNALFPA
jgi:hypothetical protein